MKHDEFSKLRSVKRQLQALDTEEADAYKKHQERFAKKREKLEQERRRLLEEISGGEDSDDTEPFSGGSSG